MGVDLLAYSPSKGSQAFRWVHSRAQNTHPSDLTDTTTNATSVVIVHVRSVCLRYTLYFVLDSSHSPSHSRSRSEQCPRLQQPSWAEAECAGRDHHPPTQGCPGGPLQPTSSAQAGIRPGRDGLVGSLLAHLLLLSLFLLLPQQL